MKSIEADQQYKPVFDLKKKIAESEGISAYLKSDRRQKYSMGVFVSLLNRTAGSIVELIGHTATLSGARRRVADSAIKHHRMPS